MLSSCSRCSSCCVQTTVTNILGSKKIALVNPLPMLWTNIMTQGNYSALKLSWAEDRCCTCWSSAGVFLNFLLPQQRTPDCQLILQKSFTPRFKCNCHKSFTQQSASLSGSAISFQNGDFNENTFCATLPFYIMKHFNLFSFFNSPFFISEEMCLKWQAASKAQFYLI